PAEAAGRDARVREIRPRYRGARDRDPVVVPHHSASRLCQRLEDQPEPLSQPGPRDGLARSLRLRVRLPRLKAGYRWRGGAERRGFRFRARKRCPTAKRKANITSAPAAASSSPERSVDFGLRLTAAAAIAAAMTALPAYADEAPKRGGTLTYMIA